MQCIPSRVTEVLKILVFSYWNVLEIEQRDLNTLNVFTMSTLMFKSDKDNNHSVSYGFSCWLFKRQDAKGNFLLKKSPGTKTTSFIF